LLRFHREKGKKMGRKMREKVRRAKTEKLEEK